LGASLAYNSRASLRACLGHRRDRPDLLVLFRENRGFIDDAVKRRVRANARQPVVLRVADL
jgi:hypothetical protein